ncbi:MAG: sorbosone dehydrogenase, partial [Gammaproteobacteria bacterium]|nr:sorbosone dehydrogenase [Gammaproteobacteria bacterium]
DGKKIGNCDQYGQPILAFPGHWAPEALMFYTGDAFPARYRGGAFIAFHGSWNRAPLPQAGYQVVFVPFQGERPAGGYEVFAGGLAGSSPLVSPDDAHFRANGVAEGPQGALYISDSQHGRIWRVVYRAP